MYKQNTFMSCDSMYIKHVRMYMATKLTFNFRLKQFLDR